MTQPGLTPMLGCMWPWRKQRAAHDPVVAEIQRIEADCLRRLDFVDMQLGRVLRRRGGRWTAAMTVAEMDIMPLGNATRVVTTVRALRPLHWYAIIAASVVVLLVVILAFAKCLGSNQTVGMP